MTNESDHLRSSGQREPPDRTRRTESYGSWLGGTTDIGRRHHTNQDAFALAVSTHGPRRAVVVVSDGVSSSRGAERASATASQILCDHLLDCVDLPTSQLHDEVRTGYRLAHDAVLAQGDDGYPVGSCTLVAAVVRGRQIHVANLGDTRAYWIPDTAPPESPEVVSADAESVVLLSVDDSMAQVRLDLGMSREEAETGAHAHAITKWVGPDAPDLAPRITELVCQRPGWLLVCSDGLWNYASGADEMGHLVRQVAGSLASGGTASAMASALVSWANHQGGRDNITVAIARIDPDQPSA